MNGGQLWRGWYRDGTKKEKHRKELTDTNNSMVISEVRALGRCGRGYRRDKLEW